MQQNEIILELDTILAIDYDKYVQRLLNYQPITRKQAIKNINDSLNHNAINNTEYRAELIANFDENNNWKVSSKEDKKSFPLWREDQFNILQNRFLKIVNDSIMPLSYCKEEETKLVLDILGNELWSETMYNLVQQSIKQDLYALAYVIGTIDHLKAVQKLTKKNIISSKKTDFDFGNKAVCIAYFFMGEILDDKIGAKALEYSNNKNVRKLLDSRISSRVEMIKLIKNKSSDTKHIKSLFQAIEFIKVYQWFTHGENKEIAIAKINTVIAEFKEKFDTYYI